MQKRSPETSAGLLRWLMAAQTGLLPTQPITAQINPGLSLWLDEKRGSRQVRVDGLRQAGHGIGKSCGATELFNQAPSPHNGTDPQQSVYLELTVG